MVVQTPPESGAMWDTWVQALGQGIHWRRKWQPRQYSCLKKSHGQELAGSTPWVHEESDTTEQIILSLSHIRWPPTVSSFRKSGSYHLSASSWEVQSQDIPGQPSWMPDPQKPWQIMRRWLLFSTTMFYYDLLCSNSNQALARITGPQNSQPLLVEMKLGQLPWEGAGGT